MIEIVIDHREPNVLIEYLKDFGATVKIQSLTVGDYIVSDRMIIERKTRDDFESSIIDQRIFSQLERMKEVYSNPVLIIEGIDEMERIGRKAMLGAYASMIGRFGVSLFFTRNMTGTAEIIYSFAKHEQEAKSNMLRIKPRVKTYSLADNQRAVIEALPKIGPKTAINMLNHFGSIQNIVNATEKELTEIDKIGKKKAELIKQILNTEFGINNKNKKNKSLDDY